MLDKAIHELYNQIEHIKWNDFRIAKIEDDYHDWYYAEDELYVIRDRIMGYLKFVKARSPKEAHDKWQDEIHSIWGRDEE